MASKNIRVLQCNVNRCHASHHRLLYHFMSNNFAIALVTEPYVGRETTVHDIRGVNIFQLPENGRVKACVMIKEKFGVALGITQLSTSNLAVVQIKIDQRKLLIASIYFEPDEDPNSTIHAIIEFITNTGGTYQLICGDINASHQLWNCETSDEREDTFASIFNANDLAENNIGNKPTFEAIRHENYCSSIVDVTIASENFTQKIEDWRVNENACVSSDHNAIELTIKSINKNCDVSRASTYLLNNKTAK